MCGTSFHTRYLVSLTGPSPRKSVPTHKPAAGVRFRVNSLTLYLQKKQVWCTQSSTHLQQFPRSGAGGCWCWCTELLCHPVWALVTFTQLESSKKPRPDSDSTSAPHRARLAPKASSRSDSKDCRGGTPGDRRVLTRYSIPGPP